MASDQKRNYQMEMERELARIEASGRKPRLLLHSCCAPCSSYVLEALNRAFSLSLFYYNPNIDTREEFELRLSELERLTRQMPLSGEVRVIPGEYEPEVFLRACSGHEQDPEGGARCERCFRLRIGRTAALARKEGFDYFATTLSISPLKNARLLNAIGEDCARDAGVPWLPGDFKKKNGYRRSCELSREYGLYRQDYCGCAFSREARLRQKLLREEGEGAGADPNPPERE